MNLAKAALLLGFALISIRAALVTPEFQIDAPAEGPSVHSESWPAVAFNGSIYIAAWQSSTNTAPITIRGSIRWKQFNAAGEPIAGDHALGDEQVWNPEIASNGNGFLLLGNQNDSNGYQQSVAYRLDASGNLIPNSKIGPVTVGSFPKVASDGTNYMLFTGFPQPTFCPVTAAGFGQVTVAPGGGGSGSDIAYDGGNYLAVWTSEGGGFRRILAHRISPSGTLLTATPIEIAVGAANGYSVTVTYAQGVFLVTWHEQQGFGGNLLARRVSPSGALLDGPFPLVSNGLSSGAAVGPHASGFLVTWYNFDRVNDIFEVRSAPITANGTMGPARIISNRASPSIRQLAVNKTGTNSLFVWATHSAESDYDVYANFIPVGGDIGEKQVLQTGLNAQSAPAASFGANGYLVVWQDTRNAVNDSDDIYGMFVDQNGRRLGPNAFPIATGLPDQTSPVVAAAGDRYLVVWREATDPNSGDYDDIKGALIVNQQVSLQLSITTATNSQRAPAVASNGKDFLVVWRDDRDNADDDIYGIHVTGDGIVSGPVNGFQICAAPYNQAAPAVASNGTNYLVVWRDSRVYWDGLGEEVYGALVEPGVTMLPANFPIGAWGRDQRGPDVASNGSDYFVVWRDTRHDGDDDDEFPAVFGTPVSAAGRVQDTAGYPVGSGSYQREPSIARLGDDYLIAWLGTDEENDQSGPYNIYARALRPDLMPITFEGEVSRGFYDSETLTLTSSGGDTALAVSQTQIGGVGRIQGMIICATNCPVLTEVAFDTAKRTIRWNVEPTETYRVEFKESLNDANWQLLVESTASFFDVFLQATDVAAATTRFYRVVKSP